MIECGTDLMYSATVTVNVDTICGRKKISILNDLDKYCTEVEYPLQFN